MTAEGLENLKELTTEVDELRDEAGKLMARIINLYQDEEDVEDGEAREMLPKATVSLQKGAWRLGCAVTELQSAYKAEKALEDFFEGLLNKEDDDEEEPREA